jgi:Domain of unknown function (DUF5063)
MHELFWRPLYSSLTIKLGAVWNQYREVFDPYDESIDKVVTGSLADDLSDIYVDLRQGEDFWSHGLFDEAVWQWRFGFESHWGEHATSALRAIRTLSASHDLRFPPDDGAN